MSKITKALEKAARERTLRQQDQPTVTGKPTSIPLTRPALDDAAVAASVQIDPHIVSAADPSSPITEQYRILRTNLQSLKGFPGCRTLVITSAVHEEGKSVTAINLALTLAQQEGLRVLLLDGDLRRGSIHRWLGLEATQGLSTTLTNGLELNGTVVKLKAPPLSILPAGPPCDHPAELLESSAMKRLLGHLKSQFDVIIVDAPPILPVADPSILAAQADGVLLVIRAGRTQRRVVLQALGLLKQSKARLLGCILTHVEFYVPGYFRYYQYYRSATDKEVK